MASKFQMQACASTTGVLYTWLSVAADFPAAGYTGPGTPLDIAVSCVGGLDTSGGGSSVPDKTITLNDGSYVVLTDGSYAVTT